MKLNYDCVRDVMLKMEEITGINENLYFEPIGLYDIALQLEKYDIKEILYTVPTYVLYRLFSTERSFING